MKKVNFDIKKQKGSITVFLSINMMFFLIVFASLYINSSNKIQKQEKQIQQMQQEYKVQDINELYEDAYDTYLETEN